MKFNEIEKVALVFGETSKVIPFKVASAKNIRAFQICNDKYVEMSKEIAADAKSFEESAINDLVYDLKFEMVIATFKTVADISQLTTAEQELFNADFTSDFWQNQDILAVADAVASFREIFGLNFLSR